MSIHPTLRKAPIVEGLIDIRVESSSAGLDSLRAAADALAADFPSREELRTFAGEVSFSAEKGPRFSASAPTPVGFVLRSADGKWVAQFRMDGFTFGRLEPYTSWDELKTRARDYWDSYNAAAKPGKIVRVATRFINRICLPLGESFDKTFTTTFNIASSLPQAVAGFLLRFVIPFNPEEAVAIVTQALPENNQDCIFDLDVFAINSDGFTIAQAWSKLEQLRDVKNRLFFDSLTSGALEKFL